MKVKLKAVFAPLGALTFHGSLAVLAGVGLSVMIGLLSISFPLPTIRVLLGIKAGIVALIVSGISFFYKAFFDALRFEEWPSSYRYVTARYRKFFGVLLSTDLLISCSIGADFYLISVHETNRYAEAISIGTFAATLLLLQLFVGSFGYSALRDLYRLTRASELMRARPATASPPCGATTRPAAGGQTVMAPETARGRIASFRATGTAAHLGPARKGLRIFSMTVPTWLFAPARWFWALMERVSEARQSWERQLREAMMAGARDFSTGVQQAIMGVKDAVEAPSRQLADISVVWAAVPEIRRLVGEAEARLARVHLGFGPESEAASAAGAAVAALRSAARNLELGGTDLEAARDAADSAATHLREFNRHAGHALRTARQSVP